MLDYTLFEMFIVLSLMLLTACCICIGTVVNKKDLSDWNVCS